MRSILELLKIYRDKPLLSDLVYYKIITKEEADLIIEYCNKNYNHRDVSFSCDKNEEPIVQWMNYEIQKLENNKDRPITELLKILLENIGFLDTGLCYLSFDLFLLKKVNIYEMEILRDYINDNNPYEPHEYMFIRGMKEPRIQWLKEQIEKLENEQV
jgi:hypothetical protein